ncbi:MAG TPA: BlaI/MecI/CopY family transcriptional regulator [Terriglobales bacterium]
MRSRSGGELPQLELECMAALWALEAAPVAAVHARLAERGRPLAYTTVLTVLDRLRRKQAVERERRGRAYVYAPRISREEMRQRAVERLVANYFDSRQELEEYLNGGGPRRAAVPPSEAVPVAVPEAVLLD